MRANYVQTSLKTAVLVTIVLLLGTSFASGQAQQVNLTAAPTTLTMPDGSMVPMWGYTCTSLAAGVTSNASCAALNTAGNGWAPVIITVPSGQDLQINLTNNLSFPAQDSNGNVTGTNNVPTSLVMVGQLGGGLGKTATYIASPNHDNQPTTWPIPNGGAIFTPPSQGPRVQSFSTEVAGTPSTVAQTATQLVWTNPRPGTYLLESGTHPSIQGSMGLYGIVVVTSAPSSSAPGCAYPGAAAGPCTVPYNADIPLLLSEIDPVQNNAVQAAVGMTGFNEAATVGPYAGGAIANINVVKPGSGYTTAPIVNIVGGGGSGATAVATIDTDNTSATYRQVLGVNITNAGTGYTSAPTVTLSGGGGTKATAAAYLTLGANAIAHCSGGALACYPPVVNYTPLYYMINGVSFDKTKGSNSLFTAAPNSGVTGNVLVRIVNAGSRMHVPAIVGSQVGASGASGFALIAEDGNPLPGVPRVQSEVFMAAGKTYDVMINVPAANSTALPIYDRELSLSGNAIDRDAGMLAYISVNGAGLPSAPALAGAIAKDDTYNSVVSGNQLSISDPAKGVIANDFNVYGVKVLTAPQHAAVVGGVVQFGLNSNGTFTYTPDASWSASSPTITDSFVYQANGSGPTATVTLGAAPIELASGIVCTSIPAYNSTVATTLSIKPPGILAFCKDAAGYPLKVAPGTVTPVGTGWSVAVDPNGGFNATVPGQGMYSFTFQAQNSQGTVGTQAPTVTLNFPQGSGLKVKVVDGVDKVTLINDYRWIIEEDRTFYVDPNNTTNVGCLNPPPGGCTSNLTFGTNFHTSYMPVVAQGCWGPTGAVSCEQGQSLLGTPAVCDVGNGVCRTGASQQSPIDPASVYLDPTKRYYISVLPGDGANPFNAGYGGAPDCSAAGVAGGSCGHGMGGAPIPAGQTSVTVLSEPTPLKPGKLSVFVFEDDLPLNGEHDAGGGIDVLSPNEPGLGSFQITIYDQAGGTGDATGQPTYDMFNMPRRMETMPAQLPKTPRRASMGRRVRRALRA
ncbi:MAG: hypothetical protein DMG68_05810 [Acidobacteria bacterium]|nr:MAG: hypothetical protein DMG68_05810 [Acidobacteriota bacterium]